jgi:hypothetical protein
MSEVVVASVALWRRLGLTSELIAQLEAAAPNVCVQLSRLERVGSEEGELPDERPSTLAIQAAPVLRCPALMALLDTHRATLNQLATRGLPSR